MEMGGDGVVYDRRAQLGRPAQGVSEARAAVRGRPETD